MADSCTFAKIRIGVASADEMRAWSHGEVKKPETINYRTFKPERDGLFCEKIFGPVKDWECHCGRYKKVKFKGVTCDRCGVEVTRAKVRRERMGHIELASPVCHIWYLKGVPSPLSLVLEQSPRNLEKVLYFASYIVTSVNKDLINRNHDEARRAVRLQQEGLDAQNGEQAERLRRDFERTVQERQLEELAEEDRWDPEQVVKKRHQLEERIRQDGEDVVERKDELDRALDLLDKLSKFDLINEDDYRALERLMDALRSHVGDHMMDAFEAGMGGVAIKRLLEEINLEELARDLRNTIATTQGPRRLRAIKRLEVVEAFIGSNTQPSWMILDCVPVISPELRPMVQLDGGRFATSDLNDLYRRIINRNNRLKKITEIRAPESIVNHEKRLLQEAVDALIDNGRRNRPVVGSTNRPLKSLSDMLKGKEGRFRKNLLGKRVDYSGRSVIVVGPHLKLHQCGLPKEMALELFKPFVMKTLVDRGYTTNIKTAKRMIDKMRPEVWDALDEVIREHPVMLNRAPTLHRLGIQAFEPVLVDGKAIQIHPLVCHAFNADFDGDQMAVHVPLSAYAQAEARTLMLSTHNLFSPANGLPIVAPTQDIVLGTFYLTTILQHEKPLPTPFSAPEEAKLAYDSGQLHLHQPIIVRVPCRYRLGPITTLLGDEDPEAPESWDGPRMVGQSDDMNEQTTVGRLILNEILPDRLRYQDRYLFRELGDKQIAEMVSEVYEYHGKETAVRFLDDLKDIGFRFATVSGVTIAMTDMDVPQKRDEILRKTELDVSRLNRAYSRGNLSAGARRQGVLKLWLDASRDVGKAIMGGFEHFNPINLITGSGARGSSRQITQLSGMRGLMADPFGNLIEDLPIKSNFHEGLNVLEYFVSTHGARKGLADTALRTADAGYLTRRLVDVAQDVIVRADDCGATSGIEVREIFVDGDVLEKLSDRIRGRHPLDDIVHPETGEVLVPAHEEISDAAAVQLDAFRQASDEIVTADGTVVAHRDEILTVERVAELLELRVRRASSTRRDPAGLPEMASSPQDISSSLRVRLRSVLTCELRMGICARCYGRDLATGRAVDIGVAVGIIAAQSIGEPGTQLTMRTFHTGGVASKELVGVANVKQKRQSALRDLHEDIRSGLVKFEDEGGSERERSRSVQAVLKVLEDQVGGLLRVVELFEARRPKGQAIITEMDGTVSEIEGGIKARIDGGQREEGGLRHVVINSPLRLDDPGVKVSGELAAEDILDATSEVIVKKGEAITDRHLRKIKETGRLEILVRKSILVPYRGDLEVEPGDVVQAGDRLTIGPLDPHKVLELRGPRGVQEYLVREIQRVYKGQGVDINDKHVEVIVRQMLKKRKIRVPGDAPFLPGQIVDKFSFEDGNKALKEDAKTEATADWVLLGITDASLATDSFLSAASFQKTTRVLTEAAVRGKKDELVGLKENVIIGRLIPAGTGLPRYRSLEPATPSGGQIIVEVAKPDTSKILPVGFDEDVAELIGATEGMLGGPGPIAPGTALENILSAVRDPALDEVVDEGDDMDDIDPTTMTEVPDDLLQAIGLAAGLPMGDTPDDDLAGVLEDDPAIADEPAASEPEAKPEE